MTKQKRFEYIETQLFWGDGLTAGRLAQTFGVSRQAAQKVIDSYRGNFPGQMEYNPSHKRHEPSADFKPVFIRTSPISFLDYLRGQALIGHYREEQDWSDIEMTDVDRLLRPDLPIFPIKIVLSALLGHRVVSIDYHSKNREPGASITRSISPNHLIFADERYHIRAYCHKKHAFLDFVLSRISHAELTDEDWVPSTEDREWHYFVKLRFKPNPNLPESVRKAILRNYQNTEKGCRIIISRKALAFYIKRKLTETEDPKYEMALWALSKI